MFKLEIQIYNIRIEIDIFCLINLQSFDIDNSI